MSWHPDCFNTIHGTNFSGSPTKYESRCEAGEKCLHGGRIRLGDKYYYRPSVASPKWNTPNKPVNQYPAQAPNFGNLGELLHEALAQKEQPKPQPQPQPQPKENSDSNQPENAAPTEGELKPSEVQESKQEQKVPQENLDKLLQEIFKGVDNRFKSDVIPQIGKAVDQKLKSKSDEITLQVLDKIASVTSTRVELVDPKTQEVKDMGLQHKQFPILLKTCMARINVWLAGPSGSGKTTAAQNVATALNLPFQYTGAVGDPYALIGFKDANGNLVRTPFREAWEHGGIFLWDEVDASDPNALLAFNAALANGTAPFPDGAIPKHKDCVLIAAANTWGHGATNEYVGRLKMDAAFLKRFAFISWDYDEQLEMETCPNKAWCARVQSVRKKVKDKGLRVLVTPRESYIGSQLLAAGIPQFMVEQMTIKSGMTEEQWGTISR